MFTLNCRRADIPDWRSFFTGRRARLHESQLTRHESRSCPRLLLFSFPVTVVLPFPVNFSENA
jgi:hypothetical protein